GAQDTLEIVSRIDLRCEHEVFGIDRLCVCVFLGEGSCGQAVLGDSLAAHQRYADLRKHYGISITGLLNVHRLACKILSARYAQASPCLQRFHSGRCGTFLVRYQEAAGLACVAAPLERRHQESVRAHSDLLVGRRSGLSWSSCHFHSPFRVIWKTSKNCHNASSSSSEGHGLPQLQNCKWPPACM